MTKKRFLLALALMLTAVGGAWAQGNTTPVNWNAATRTGSLTTPAGNVTLTVDYYGQYTLDSVPTAEGWQVKVNGSLATVTPYTPGSALGHVDNINETDSVELIPPDSLKNVIKSVRLVDNSTPPAPATVLSGALVDGAIIKVNFKWRGDNFGDYVQGVYNAASGTFTASKGGSYWSDDERAVYTVEKSGDNIIIGAGFYGVYEMEAMVWTFNTTNDTYTTTNGIYIDSDYGLISVTLNGTDITSQLTAQ